MPIVNQNGTRADLGEVAGEGIHLPEPTTAHSTEDHEGHDHDNGRDDHEHSFEIVEVFRVVFVALAVAVVWFHFGEPFHRVSVIGLVATLIGGYTIFKEAFENILEHRMTMELSMSGWAKPLRTGSSICWSMEDMLRKHITKFSLKLPNYSTYVELDFEIHGAIWDLAENKQLVVMLERLAGPMIGLASRVCAPMLK
jgi:cation transport ATPase